MTVLIVDDEGVFIRVQHRRRAGRRTRAEDSGCDTRRGRGEAQAMDPGETTEAPNMGMRVTCRESAASSGGALLSFDFWMRGGATPPPMHVHPHQEERITVVSGSVRSRSGAADRVLSRGDTVVSPPGEPHTVGPAGNGDVEMIAERRPALSYEQFIERSFALDRAGFVNAKGRGNPLRMATARPHEADSSSPVSQSGCSEPCSAHLTGSAGDSRARAVAEAAAAPRPLLLDHLGYSASGRPAARPADRRRSRSTGNTQRRPHVPKGAVPPTRSVPRCIKSLPPVDGQRSVSPR